MLLQPDCDGVYFNLQLGLPRKPHRYNKPYKLKVVSISYVGQPGCEGPMNQLLSGKDQGRELIFPQLEVIIMMLGKWIPIHA